MGYEFVYLYTAPHPFSGNLFSILLPDMTKDSFAAFAVHFARHASQLYGADKKVLLLLDGVPVHQLPYLGHVTYTKELQGLNASNLVLEHQPTVSPEFNPVEHFFEELRKELANQVIETLEEVENKISEILKKYYDNPQAISSLCNYPYLSIT